MTRVDRLQDHVSPDVDPKALTFQIEGGGPEQLDAVTSAVRGGELSAETLRQLLSAVRRRAGALQRTDAGPGALLTAVQQLEATIQAALADHRQAATKAAAQARATASPLRQAVLVELANGPSVPKDLASAVARRSESVSRILKEMLADGVVTVDGDPTDGRKRVYALTPAGEAQAADAVTYVGNVDARPVRSAAGMEEILRETLSAAVALRRRSSRREETFNRLAVVRRHAAGAGAAMIALEALQESIVTLRQAGRVEETQPYLAELERLTNGEDAAFNSSTMLPALGFLEYELGRHRETELAARAGHLVTSSYIFSRLALASEGSSTRWRGRQAWALVSLADNLRQQSDLGEALRRARAAERIFQANDDMYGVVRATFVAGFCLRLRGQFVAASQRLETAHAMARDEGFAAFEADALMQLGEVRRCQGDLNSAGEMLAEAYERATRLVLPLTQAFSQSALAAANHAQGREGAALGQLIEAHELFEQRGHRDGLALNLRRRAVVTRETNPGKDGFAEASAFVERARDLYVGLRSPAGLVACDVEAGNVAVAAGEDVVDVCKELRAVLVAPTSRRMLELDPWVPPLVLDFAEQAGDDELKKDAKVLVAQNDLTLQEHQTESEADVIPLCASTKATGGRTSRGRHVDPMAGEPRRLRPETDHAAA